jgi:hypothetical protein
VRGAWRGLSLEQNLLALDLPPGAVDGVFANAVLFHVPGAAT